MKHPKYEVWTGADGRWRWHIRETNGEIVVKGGGDFPTRKAAMKDIVGYRGATESRAHETAAVVDVAAPPPAPEPTPAPVPEPDPVTIPDIVLPELPLPAPVPPPDEDLLSL